jgi:tyrosyl-tRNA synthetase
MTRVEEQIERIARGTAAIIPDGELAAKLKEGRPLRVKLGVDPTAPDIHLGHTVALTKLRQFQDLGHRAILIIGDFTALIGDPSGRSSTRPQLDRAAVGEAARTYQEQVFKVLDRERVEVRFNGEWFAALGFEDVIRLGAKTTVARMLERDDFAQRHREGTPIGVHELLYPLMQAHDSVEVRADVELGGTDQTFNILLGRHLQKEAGQAPQVAVILPLLEGTDGTQKMSKSLGNYIGVAEPPEEIFGKIMSISDELMLRYYELLTEENVRRLRRAVSSGDLHPMEAKKRLGETLVERFHGAAAAARARAAFEARFQRGQLDVDALPEIHRPADETTLRLPALLREAGLVQSNSEARRLIRQRGVRVDGGTVETEEVARGERGDLVVEVGKRRAVRVRFGASGR